MCDAHIFVSCMNPWFLCQILAIIWQSIRAPLQMACFLLQIPCLASYAWALSGLAVMGGGLCCMHEVRCMNIVVGVDSNGWFCAGVSEMILARDIYYDKPNPKPDPQSSYWVRKGLGTRAPQSTWDCDLATVISIRPLNQPSIFSDMSWIKVASRIWAALCIIPST